MIGLVAERDRARLVLADRGEHGAERRVDHAVDQREPEQAHHEHEAVHHGGIAEIDPAEQLFAKWLVPIRFYQA